MVNASAHQQSLGPGGWELRRRGGRNGSSKGAFSQAKKPDGFGKKSEASNLSHLLNRQVSAQAFSYSKNVFDLSPPTATPMNIRYEFYIL